MSEINRRTSLVTISLGSGGDADVMFLFASDICGESSKRPRHARAWGDLASLYKAVRDERVKALSGFRAAVASGELSRRRRGRGRSQLANWRRSARAWRRSVRHEIVTRRRESG